MGPHFFLPITFIGIIAGILLGRFHPDLISPVGAGLFLLWISFFLFLRRSCLFALIMLIFLFVFLSNRSLSTRDISRFCLMGDWVEGVILYKNKTHPPGTKFKFVVETKKMGLFTMGAVPVYGRIICYGGDGLKVGMGVRCYGEVNPLPEGQQFSRWKNVLQRKGVGAIIYRLRKLEILSMPTLWRTLLQQSRLQIKKIYNSLFPREYGLLTALLFGEKKGVASGLYKKFKDTGAAHLMAVSGMHVGFLAICWYWVAALFSISHRRAFTFFCLFLMIYAGLCGFTPSIMRAGLMVVFYGLGFFIRGGGGSSIHSLSASGILLLLLDPRLLFSVSFQLSYTAVLSIILFYKDLQSFPLIRHLPVCIGRPISVSLAAQLGLLPMLVVYFGRLVPFSPLILLLLFPLTIIAAVVSLGAGVLGSLTASVIPAEIAAFFVSILSWTAGVFHKLPFSIIKIPSFSLLGGILYYLLLILLIKGRTIFGRITPYFRYSLTAEITAFFKNP